MSASIYNPLQMGAVVSDQGTSFRVWAPHAASVSVVGEFNDWDAAAHPMRREENDRWAAAVPQASPGQQYQFEIVNGDKRFRKTDPYARAVHPEKRTSVVYRDTFKWSCETFPPIPWNELVIYELHVGNFEPNPNDESGRFGQVAKRLPYLKHLGINALEIMPAAQFPGQHSWGYNTTNPLAVESNYGGADGLKRLIDAAHRHGIAIILDVVYNHFGPDNLDLWQFDGWNENNRGGIYFYNDHRAWTPWGENRPDYGRGEVRQYIRDSAMLWLDEFKADGLRFDSTLFIRNTRGDDNNPETDIPEGWSLLQWINEETRRFFPHALTIAEDLMRNPWLTKSTGEGGAGFSTQWDAGFVHPIRSSVVAVNDDGRSMGEIARAISIRYNDDVFQRVVYSESHDEVANGKARIPQEISPDDTDGYFARKRSTLAAGLVFTAPGISMIFEGQEFLEDGWFRDEVPLDWSKLDQFRGINRLYHDLIHLRRNHYGHTRGLTGQHVYIHHINNVDKVIAFHRWEQGGPGDDVVVVASFTHRSLENYKIGLPQGGAWQVRFSSHWKGYSPDFKDSFRPEGEIIAEPGETDDCKFAGTLALAPYALIILSQDPVKP